ncbi:hypothetical protein [Comamonas antarctica]|uniref:hypothetical protein n=1 Tax=Comamonas antarctica TaxID=2743470 RepID=UPI0028F0FE02|nr:hypothetical protein [Comamonas antarctica]
MSNLIAYLDRPIAFQRAFVDLGAGITGALMLSQAIYWARRTTEDCWFYKTVTEWTEETGLSRTEQENARAKLQKLGVLEVVRRGVPAKLYFRVDNDGLLKALEAHPPENKIAGNLQTGSQVSRKPVARKPASKSPRNTQSIKGKTTKETTAETTPENIAPGAEAPVAPMLVTAANGIVHEIPGDLRYPGDGSKTHKAWIAYAIAYHGRYHSWPIWNATVAGQISNFIERVGIERAPRIAVHYVRRVHEEFVVKQMHPVKLLLSDAEKWATQCETGRTVTSEGARQADRTAANANTAEGAAAKAIAMVAERRARAAQQQGGAHAE